MNTKTLYIISLVIVGIVVVNEIQWLGRTNMAIVILGLAIAVGLNALAGILKGKI